MPRLFNLVAIHHDGRRTYVSDCPLSWKQAQREWLQYIDAHCRWFDTLENSLDVVSAGLHWSWIDTALSLTQVENFFVAMCE